MVTVWLIGKQDRGGVPQLLPEVIAITSGTVIVSFEDLSEAIAARRSASPDVLIVFQHHPNEFSPCDVECLIGAHPLANLLVALGPWCQSLRRSNCLWPDTVATPLHSLTFRVAEVLEVAQEPLGQFPRSLGHDERLRLIHEREHGFAEGPAIVVISGDQSLKQSISLGLSARGAILLPPAELDSADSVIFDLDPISIVSLKRLNDLKWTHPHVRHIGLTAWPNHELAALARRHGADYVMSKPIDLAEIEAVFKAILLKRCVTTTCRQQAA